MKHTLDTLSAAGFEILLSNRGGYTGGAVWKITIKGRTRFTKLFSAPESSISAVGATIENAIDNLSKVSSDLAHSLYTAA